MAKSRTAKRGVAPQQIESPVRPNKALLTLEERERLRAIILDPVYLKAWNNAQLDAPSVVIAPTQLIPDPLGDANGLQRGNNRFHEIRGWKMFEVALLRQLNDPAPKRAAVAETWQQT